MLLTKKVRHSLSSFIGCTLLFSSQMSYADILVESLSLTKQSRVSRFDYRYEMQVTVKNDADTAENIAISVSSNNTNGIVQNSDLTLSSLGSGESALMNGSLVLIVNRREAFNENDLTWDIQYDRAEVSIADTFSENSAYHTGVYPNFFVEQGIANEEQVITKLQSTYAQLFELIPDEPIAPVDSVDAVFYQGFTDGFTGWATNGDNGTEVTATLAVVDEALQVTPIWDSNGDNLSVKFQQFHPIDITSGATIVYEMEVADDYVTDGSMAVQLIIEDANFNPGFFGYRALVTNGRVTITVENVGPDTGFGFIAEDFDFTQVRGFGFQFLANGKATSVAGDIIIDEVSISLPNLLEVPAEEAFIDSFDNDINNWVVSADNDTSVNVVLSENAGTLNLSPSWQSNGDVFTVKYQQFDAVDITGGANISFDVKLPASYVNDGSMVTQLVIEDANYQPGFIGYASIAGHPADEFFTLTFTNVSPSASFGYISGGFDFTKLSGVGLQILAGGKAVDIVGDIQIDNVKVSAAAASDGPVIAESNTSLLYGVGEDMAFIKAIDSNDIRSEGMSYGMFISVLMDDQATFNKLWTFTKEKMQNKSGVHKDFFAWQLSAVAPYAPIAANPAPDGEEFFAMALFFANNRWGSTTGIYDYQTEANSILHDMIYTQSDSTRLMMNPIYKQIEFVTTPNIDSFTDPSYHLPAFYELWALWADADNDYWHEVAVISREFLGKAAHPVTGLYSDYASHDGAPQYTSFNNNSHKSAYDSYRVMGNLALDYYWISESADLKELVDRQVNFFNKEVMTKGDFIAIYEVDGIREPGINYRGHGRTAMNAFGATASENPFAKDMIEYLWQQDAPTGKYRYYDGMLHMMSLLHVSGGYKIYKPE